MTETDYRYYFRAWDKKEKCYGLVLTTIPTRSDETRLVPPPSADPKRFEIEQYTGLCDSKGEKIFEHDVLRLPAEDTNMPMKVVWFSNLCLYRLVPVYEEPYVETMLLCKLLADCSQIIGNDHQLSFKEDKEVRNNDDEK